MYYYEEEYSEGILAQVKDLFKQFAAFNSQQ
jgi:hypothetical protein